MKGMVAFMERKIVQQCPVYRTKEDVIDTWFLGVEKIIGVKNISKEDIERIVTFGYEIDGNNRLKIKDAQADIIREIYWMYIWGIPLKEICRKREYRNYREDADKYLQNQFDYMSRGIASKYKCKRGVERK